MQSSIELLKTGEIYLESRMPFSSNATFRVIVQSGDQLVRAIYKPKDGERSLWDFPRGLHRREIAAYELAVVLGIPFIPPTVLRDGPLGEGSLQLYIKADPDQHYFSLFESHAHLHDRFREIAFFDFVANNTDRKSGHVLIDENDQIWGIDQGLCFSVDFKLRTVIWEFAGEQINQSLLDAAHAIRSNFPLPVATMLDSEEIGALITRCDWLLEHRVFPSDQTGRRYPWPLI